MAKTIIFENANGERLELSNSAPFILNKIDTDANINIYSNSGMLQDGSTYLSNKLDARDISLEVTTIGKTEAEVLNYRSLINKIFNPKLGPGWLIYKDCIKERKIKAIINNLPKFNVIKRSQANKCLISLTANNPYWLEVVENKKEIALWKGDFEFILEILEEGIEMGHREPSLIVNVCNNGDVDCGMRVEFKALATVENPSITDINNREFLKINKKMIPGEVISISTYFGNKSVLSSLNGITENAFNYIDFNSTFMQLGVGDNLYRYDAEKGVDNLEVNIYYQPQYLGV